MMAGETAAAVRERVLRSVRPLDKEPGAVGWNHEDMRLLIGDAPRRSAAVLLGLVDREEGLNVLLTRRTDDLSHHAGQVSFPGGGVEPEDADAVAAALRETREEIGVESALIEPVGYLDTFETISSYCITPVVAWVDAGYRAVPNPREVAEVFEVPLAHFLDPEKKHVLRMSYQGREREIYEFFYGGQRIWGATAAMLLNFVHRMEIASP